MLEFATLDYMRKYLTGEPMLAQRGETGWDPGVQAEVEAAAKHRPRLTPRQEKMIKSQEGKKWKPRKGYKTAPAGKDVVADVEGNVPGTSSKGIAAGIKTQQENLTKVEPAAEPLPSELLKGPGGKIPFDPDVVMKGGHPNVPDLWDVQEAAKPSKVKVTFNRNPRLRPRIPRNEAERIERRKQVSAHAQAFRDPEASHLARIEAGLTSERRETYKERIPGVKKFRLNPVRAEQEVHRAQGIRDVLAKKGWAYRKNVLAPLRAYRREKLGLPAVAPLGKATWKRLIPELRFEAKKRKPLKLKPTVNIVGKEFQPGALRILQDQFEKDLGKRLGIHKRKAEAIRSNIHARVGESTLPLEKGRELEQEAMDKVRQHFDPGRTDPINKLDAQQIASFTGHSPEAVETLHKAFRKHTYLGETQAGEDELRKKIFPRSLKRVPATVDKPVNEALRFPLLKKTGIGVGAAVGAAGAGAYLVHKLRQRKRRNMLQQMSSSRNNLIQFGRTEQFTKSIGNPKIHPALRNAIAWHLRENQLPGSALLSGPNLPKRSSDANEAARLLSYRRHPALSKKYANSPWPRVPGYDNKYAPFPQLSARLREIRFQQLTDPYSQPTPWHRKEARRWLLFPESRSRALYKGVSRAKGLVSDIRAPKTAEGRIIGDRGRERQAEWQKPWFKRTVITGGIVGTALAGRHVYKKLKLAEQAAAGLAQAHLPIPEGKRAAVNIVTGNWARAIAKKFPKTSGALSSASQRSSGFGQQFKQELKSFTQSTASRFNKAVEGEVGPITSGRLIRNKKTGVIQHAEWDNPAVVKENIEAAQKTQAEGIRKHAAGVAAEKRARKASGTRKSMEEELNKLSSRLRLIRFQYEGSDLVRVGGYSRGPVPVREHYRGPRGSQPKSRNQKFREGALLGIGGTGVVVGTGLGARYGWNRYATKMGKEESERLATAAVDREILREKQAMGVAGATVKTARKKVAAAAGGEAAKLKAAVKRAGKIAGKVHPLSSRIPVIRFGALDTLRSKIAGPQQGEEPSPIHDIAVGAVEGGLTFPVSAWATKKLLGKTPGIGREMLVGGAVGGIATGLVGAGLGAALRERRKIKRNRERQMSSRLKLIQFQNQRLLVAKDRYVKQVHERDIERADKLYAKAGLLGAGIGVLRKPSTFKSSAFKGALAGVGIQKLARMYGASTRDQFGERSVTGKRVERAPEWIGTAALGGHVLKRLGFFSSKAREIRFKLVDNPLFPKDKKSTVQVIPISKIVSTQEAVSDKRVETYKKKPGRKLPELHKVGKKYYVEDGNHRIVSKMEKGETTVRAKVMEMMARLREIRFDEFNRQRPEPTAQLRNVAIGSGALGLGYGGLELGKTAVQWRKIAPQVLEAADTIRGSRRVGRRALSWLRSKLHLQSKLREIRFDEAKRKHNIGAALLIGATGLPLYKGAGKMSRAAGLFGGSKNAGHRVADYIEAGQHVLNQGVTGKIMGAALRNPEHPAAKWVLGKGQSALGELGSGKEGINKLSREHFSAFRSSHLDALDAWASETVDHYEKGALGALTAGNATKAQNRLNDAKQLRSHYKRLQGHLQDLRFKGYNEKEAIREAASDPRHDKLFNRMAEFKGTVMPEYAKMAAGLAAVPATAGLAVAATTRKNRSGGAS